MGEVKKIEPGYYTVKTLAEYLVLSTKTIYRKVENQEIPHSWFWGELRFPKDRIKVWEEKHTIKEKRA